MAPDQIFDTRDVAVRIVAPILHATSEKPLRIRPVLYELEENIESVIGRIMA